MHIAYSSLKKTPQPATKQIATEQLSARFKAYQAACDKYSKEIAAIQQYIPGWVPAPPGQ